MEHNDAAVDGPTSSPSMTTIIELNTKQPVDLRYEGTPGESLMFHGVFSNVCKQISDENRDWLGNKGVILAGVERENHEHVVLVIGWSGSVPPAFTSSSSPDVLSPLLPLLSLEPLIQNLTLDGNLQLFRNSHEIILDYVDWTIQSEAGVDMTLDLKAVEVFLKETETSTSGVSSHSDINGTEIPNNLVLGRRSWGELQDGSAGNHVMLLWWRELAAARQGSFYRKLSACQEDLKSRGMQASECLLHCFRYYPAVEDTSVNGTQNGKARS